MDDYVTIEKGADVLPSGAQQPWQIDPFTSLSTAASSRATAGLLSRFAPFIWLPTPDEDRAVPDEFVPGAAGDVPDAPPVEEWCAPPPPPPLPKLVVVGMAIAAAIQRMETILGMKIPPVCESDSMVFRDNSRGYAQTHERDGSEDISMDCGPHCLMVAVLR